MHRFRNSHRLIALVLAAGLPLTSAVPPAIGFVTAAGAVQLDASPVARHGTLFQGSTVETASAGSQIEIPKAATVHLGSASRAQMFRDHMILEKGDSEVSGAAHFWVEARGLRIDSPESTAVAMVSLRGDKKVMVMALGGPVRVANTQGVAVAWVKAGKTLQLEPQEGGTAPVASTLTGCLQKIGGHYFLVDQTTAIKVELKGAGLDGQVANQVTITGIPDASGTVASGASQVIDATSVTPISTHCVAPPDATAPAGSGGSAATGSHFSATTAVIAGVVVVGTAAIVVGVVAANSKSPISQ
jgi:hypothetical protein